ncbi:hypothetical protein [Chitinophaga vietnamensis]|uniref:hypothetical protein n=1 Tax=Chitinophaga vietnamensis TaxID=2593957 RepID=UPI0011787360|nr:hypothetical protein [Chitinophaga vietnamensis]
MHHTTTKVFYHTAMACILLLAAACSKDKSDVRAGNEPDYSNMAKSTVRLVTFTNSDVMVNGVKVTSWHFNPANSSLPDVPYPTPYFPSTGKLSGAWFLPQQFLDGKGQATIKTGLPQGAPAPDIMTDSFQVQDDYNHPWDYYLGTSAEAKNGIYTVSRVPRTTVLPSAPDHIRIRLVNLCTALGNGGSGTLSLAYADGTPVSNTTSGIGNHQWSDYIELPYGTYQFKVLIDGSNLQIPGKTPTLTEATSEDNFSLKGTQVYYSPVQTFQPGGVYTLAVGIGFGAYGYKEYPLYPNCFTVITDITPAVNVTYGHVQLVNAFVDGNIQWQVDGANASTAAYGKGGSNSTLVTGAHTIKVMDATGKVLVEKNIDLKGGDNLSLWVYPDVSGNAAITVVANNMGGIRVQGANPDGSDAANNIYDPLKFNMLVQTRFLNLCPDLPYVTFTGINGALFQDGMFSAAAAAQQLQPGQAPAATVAPYPYVDLKVITGGNVQAYRSQPGVMPGDRLTDVPALTIMDFVRMPNYYFYNGNYGAEPGVYTVALIGRSKAGQHPKMIVIKHNQ